MSRRAVVLLALCVGLPAAAAVAAAPPSPEGGAGGAGRDSVIVARPGGGEVLDLDTCARLALEGNDALRAERLRLRELSGKKLQALATGLPTLDATATWTRGRDPTFALDSTRAARRRPASSAPLRRSEASV